LWLSTDGNPVNKRLIASVWGWTNVRQWNKYTTQQSASINLIAGQQYYIEALYKENEGGDNMAVGWQLPDGTLERPVPGNRLSPFEDAAPAMSAGETTEGELYSQIRVYPNPVKSSDPQLTISGYEGFDKMIETHIQIVNLTGEVVYAETIQCGGGCDSYVMKLNSKLAPGVYLITVKAKGGRYFKRLLVN
jgi:hypothetical protein